MAVFLYKAQNIQGIEVKGKIQCNDEISLYLTLRDKGFYLTHCKQKRILNFKNMHKKISRKELSILCKQLSTIVGCGINIDEALHLLAMENSNSVIKDSIKRIRKEVEKGESLSDSFQLFQDKYPALMINMIRAGEEGGNLDKVFDKLSEYFCRDDKIIKKVKSALAYPVMLFVLTIFIMLIMLLKIIPSFALTLSSMGSKIPFATSLIISISMFVKHSLLLIILFNILVMFLGKIYFTSENGKIKFYSILLKVPFVNRLYKKYIENKFIGCMSILMESGNTIFNSIKLSKQCTKNSIINNQISISLDDIMVGKSTLESLRKIEIIDAVVLSMISVGEESGTLPEMLKKCCEIIDEELIVSIDRATNLLGPFMIVFLAIVIGLMIFSIMLPIFNIMDSIK